MRYVHALNGVGSCLLVGALLVGAGSVRALTVQSHAGAHPAAALNPAPHNWHVIAGYGQALPADNGNTEAVDQFYPRTLTIHPGDSVTWTVQSPEEIHTVTFAPDPVLRKLENPQNQGTMQTVNGKQALVANPAVFFPSAHGMLVERDSGSAQTLLNCGTLGPVGTPNAQSCTITFPNVGKFAYDCLIHSGIPGFGDMDGVINVVPRPMPANHTWTVLAGTGDPIDANDGFVPDALTIQAGDKVTWKSGGVHFHTVTFGLDPRKVPFLVPVGMGPRGPILAFNPQVINPIMPAGGMYTGGVASSGVFNLYGNFVNLPGQTFLKSPFTLTFPKPGVYTYHCLVHGILMKGTITVVAATS